MKKFLLSIATMAMASGVMFAEGPSVSNGMVFSAISENGEWVVSSDEVNYVFSIVNLMSGEVVSFSEADGFSPISVGLGHAVSNDGVVVGAGYFDSMPYYYDSKGWHSLPILDSDFGAYPNAITPDGSRIVGSVARRMMSA